MPFLIVITSFFFVFFSYSSDQPTYHNGHTQISAQQFTKTHGTDTWLALEKIKDTSIDEIHTLEGVIPDKALFKLFKLFYPEAPFELESWYELEHTIAFEKIIDHKDHKSWHEPLPFINYQEHVNPLRVKGAFKHNKYKICSCTDMKHKTSDITQSNNCRKYNQGRFHLTGTTQVELITEDGNTQGTNWKPWIHQKKNSYFITQFDYDYSKVGDSYWAFEKNRLIGDPITTFKLNDNDPRNIMQSEVQSNVDSKSGKCEVITIKHALDDDTVIENHFVATKAESAKRLLPFILYKLGRKIQKENLDAITQSNQYIYSPQEIDISSNAAYRNSDIYNAYTLLMRDSKRGPMDQPFYGLKEDLRKTRINPLLHQRKSYNIVRKKVSTKNEQQKKMLENHTYGIVKANIPHQWL